MSSSSEARREDVWLELVIALLSVNQYSLDRTYACLDRLADEKFGDPLSFRSWTLDELIEKLKRAGCDRGPFMTRLFAERLLALRAAVCGESLMDSDRVLRSSDRGAIERLLMPVHGIGPKVLKNFYMLRGI